MKLSVHIRLAFVVLLAGGCHPPSYFGADHLFRHPTLGYRIASNVPSREQWRLDNFQLDPSGNPVAPKTGPDYVQRVSVDFDDDGRFETWGEVPTYDLLYTSRRGFGRMYLSSFPLTARRADTALAALGRLYVEAVSGSGIEVHDIEGRTSVVGRRFATRVVTERDVALDGAPAREVVFEVANLDQLELDPQARWERVRIVLARPGLWWNPNSTLGDPARRLPLLVVFGYSNHPDEYASEEPDFDRWLAEFRFAPDVSQATSDGVLACLPSQRTVSVISALAANGSRFGVPGATPAERACVSRALDAVRRSARDRSWVFVRRDVAPPLATSGGESASEPVVTPEAPVAPSAAPPAADGL